MDQETLGWIVIGILLIGATIVMQRKIYIAAFIISAIAGLPFCGLTIWALVRGEKWWWLPAIPSALCLLIAWRSWQSGKCPNCGGLFCAVYECGQDELVNCGAVHHKEVERNGKKEIVYYQDNTYLKHYHCKKCNYEWEKKEHRDEEI